MTTTLYGPCLVNWQGPHRYCRIEPSNPQATWWIAISNQNGEEESALVHRLSDTRWEQLYAGLETSKVKTTPFTISELQTAKPVIVEIPITCAIVKRHLPGLESLLANHRRSSRNVTGWPYRAAAGTSCVNCQRPAVVRLAAFHTGRPAAYLVRNFCRQCLIIGEACTSKMLICHICRHKGADLEILSIPHPHRNTFYEFRVHNQCVTDLDRYLQEWPTAEERRPLHHIIVG